MEFDLAAHTRRLLWRGFAIGVAIQMAGCALIAYLLGDEGDRWFLFVLLVGALIAASILNILFAFVGRLILGAFNNSDYYEAMFLDDLKKMGVPPPREYHSKSWEYLADVADDEEYPAAQRVAAARLYHDAQAMVRALPLTQTLQCQRALSAAVARFAAESPSRK
jgi:hypothetical protein